VTALPFDSAAREEFLDAVDYYQADSPRVAAEFIAAVEHAAESIAAFPELGVPYLAGTRRVLLQRFPFSLDYEVD
jgi:toxin ParE1/3/4